MFYVFIYFYRHVALIFDTPRICRIDKMPQPARDYLWGGGGGNKTHLSAS